MLRRKVKFGTWCGSYPFNKYYEQLLAECYKRGYCPTESIKTIIDNSHGALQYVLTVRALYVGKKKAYNQVTRNFCLELGKRRATTFSLNYIPPIGGIKE